MDLNPSSSPTDSLLVDEYADSISENKLGIDTDECILDETEIKIAGYFDLHCVEIRRAVIISLIWLFLGDSEYVTIANFRV